MDDKTGLPTSAELADQKELMELTQLAASVPVEMLYSGPERYEPMDPDREGSWRVLTDGGLPAAVLWTDWDKGFGTIALRSGDLGAQLDSYVVSAKRVAVPAGWAYTTMETFVNRLGEELELLEPKTGKLEGALRTAHGLD